MRIFQPLIALFTSVLFGQTVQHSVNIPTDRNAIAFSLRAEGALMSHLHEDKPIIEAYFQLFEPSKGRGYIPEHDYYALGRFVWRSAPTMEDIHQHISEEKEELLLNGIVQTMVPDWGQLSTDRYDFQFVRLAFLGALRCLVYDVKPVRPNDDGFSGRIYIEDKTWNIVRFMGVLPHVDKMFANLRRQDSKFRIDSWRLNVTKDRWVPAYVYVEEVPSLEVIAAPIIKGQIRFWGYNGSNLLHQEESVNIQLKPSSSTQEDRMHQWSSPAQNSRDFEKQAEQNVLDRLSQGSFLGAGGDVEKMLEQVLTNLILTNNLMLAEPLHCRVLLTTPLETFTVGNTIVISRGLIDVLPTESALALVLAHQLAHNVLGHPKVDTKLAFPDVLRISDADLLAKLRFRHSEDEEAIADTTAMKILEKSPYRSTLADGGLFMQAIQESAAHLTNLIQPHFGEHVADTRKVVANDTMTRTTPVLDHQLVDQVAALPLGSKLVLHPWDGRVSLLRAEPLTAQALRERIELTVTPFVPFVDYAAEKSTTIVQLPTVSTRHSAPRGRVTAAAPVTKLSASQMTRTSDTAAARMTAAANSRTSPLRTNASQPAGRLQPAR